MKLVRETVLCCLILLCITSSLKLAGRAAVDILSIELWPSRQCELSEGAGCMQSLCLVVLWPGLGQNQRCGYAGVHGASDCVVPGFHGLAFLDVKAAHCKIIKSDKPEWNHFGKVQDTRTDMLPVVGDPAQSCRTCRLFW